ncbi:hypothetical protein HDV00_002557 [Rhizophlyctis rosea]|nr:hypothetical protein HDV00_002557 [Rhizophlyctis rosea]
MDKGKQPDRIAGRTHRTEQYSPLQVHATLLSVPVSGARGANPYRMNLCATSLRDPSVFYMAVNKEILIYKIPQHHPKTPLKPIRKIPYPAGCDTDENGYTVEHRAGPINAIRVGYLGTEEVLATVDDLGRIFVWYTEDWGRRPIMLRHSDSTWGVAIHPSRLLAVSSNSHTIVVYNLASYSDADTAASPSSAAANLPAPEPRGEGLDKCELFGHLHNIPSIDFTSCGKFLVSSSIDCTTRLWYLRTGQTVAMKVVKGGQSSWNWAVRCIPRASIKRIPATADLICRFNQQTTCFSAPRWLPVPDRMTMMSELGQVPRIAERYWHTSVGGGTEEAGGASGDGGEESALLFDDSDEEERGGGAAEWEWGEEGSQAFDEQIGGGEENEVRGVEANEGHAVQEEEETSSDDADSLALGTQPPHLTEEGTRQLHRLVPGPPAFSDQSDQNMLESFTEPAAAEMGENNDGDVDLWSDPDNEGPPSVWSNPDNYQPMDGEAVHSVDDEEDAHSSNSVIPTHPPIFHHEDDMEDGGPVPGVDFPASDDDDDEDDMDLDPNFEPDDDDDDDDDDYDPDYSDPEGIYGHGGVSDDGMSDSEGGGDEDVLGVHDHTGDHSDEEGEEGGGGLHAVLEDSWAFLRALGRGYGGVRGGGDGEGGGEEERRLKELGIGEGELEDWVAMTTVEDLSLLSASGMKEVCGMKRVVERIDGPLNRICFLEYIEELSVLVVANQSGPAAIVRVVKVVDEAGEERVYLEPECYLPPLPIHGDHAEAVLLGMFVTRRDVVGDEGALCGFVVHFGECSAGHL